MAAYCLLKCGTVILTLWTILNVSSDLTLMIGSLLPVCVDTVLNRAMVTVALGCVIQNPYQLKHFFHALNQRLL